MRDVEESTGRIAQRYGNPEFVIAASRLSDLETKGTTPSIYRLYSLAAVYHLDLSEILSWLGLHVGSIAEDGKASLPKKSHLIGALIKPSEVQIPVSLDPGFDARQTADFGRMVEKWGDVPMAYLAQFARPGYVYGYVGTEDLTMYPLLMPGSFLQVDETKSEVVSGCWRSEYERPIYFVETRSGHTCCWCTLEDGNIILQPHPLSPVSARVLRFPNQAEVIGQVVGVAMRLGEWVTMTDDRGSRAAHSSG